MTLDRFADIASEGVADAAVLRRLLREAKIGVSAEHGQKGKVYLDKRITAFNYAARFNPWAVLRDLDDDEACASALARRLLPKPSKHMVFRIAVREIEAWLMADISGFAEFFSVPTTSLPHEPDTLKEPKTVMLLRVEKSRKRSIREAMVYRNRSGGIEVGPEYNSFLSEFIDRDWSPKRAAAHSQSLKRAIMRINELNRDR